MAESKIMTMNKERTYQRFHIELSARYRPCHSPSLPFEITVINIGPEGLCFLSKRLLRIGEIMELQVNLEENNQALFKVQVIWMAEFGAGIYKTGVKVVDAASGDQKKFIKYYCEKLLSLTEDPQSLNSAQRS